jgi:hypothetical protein
MELATRHHMSKPSMRCTEPNQIVVADPANEADLSVVGRRNISNSNVALSGVNICPCTGTVRELHALAHS